jgi:hypothetical protein
MDNNKKEFCLDCAYYANIAYKSSDDLINTVHLKDNKHTEKLDSSYVFFSSSDEDAQCFISIYEPLDALLVCFRGTNSFEDWMHNINAIKQIMPIEGLRKKEYPHVHSGFYCQFKSLERFIDLHISQYKENRKKTHLLFVGHSLGAALSSIASLHYYHKCFGSKITCINFGSPRVGNSDFASLFNKTIQYKKRFVNYLDPVPELPSRFRFKHVDDKTYFDEKGNMIENFEKSSCCSYPVKLLKACNVCKKNVIGEHLMDKYYSLINNEIFQPNLDPVEEVNEVIVNDNSKETSSDNNSCISNINVEEEIEENNEIVEEDDEEVVEDKEIIEENAIEQEIQQTEQIEDDEEKNEVIEEIKQEVVKVKQVPIKVKPQRVEVKKIVN